MPEHGSGLSPFALVTVTVAVVAAAVSTAAYVRAARRARGRPWPPARTAGWVAAMAGVVLAAVLAAPGGHDGVLAAPGGHDGVRHMMLHVVLAMAVPLLLAWSAPITLALCTLPVRTARRLVAVLRSRPIATLTNPFVAAALDAGGLWLFFGTPVLAASEHEPLLRTLVWVHLVAAGWLLSTVLVGADRGLRRSSFPVRAVVLLLVTASHDILAKSIYADATDARARAGAMIMYYAGDVVHVAMMVSLCASWFARFVLSLSKDRGTEGSDFSGRAPVGWVRLLRQAQGGGAGVQVGGVGSCDEVRVPPYVRVSRGRRRR